jgi:predicted nuclease of predicted toxin-antitoxin system
MRIYLDENVNPRLARFLPGLECTTPTAAGWIGITNGRLLALLEDSHDVLITHDRNLVHQQNRTGCRLAVLVLRMPGRRVADYERAAPHVLKALETIEPGANVEVNGAP